MRSNALTDRILELILKSRWWILVVVFSVTIFAIRTVASTEFTASLAKSFVDNPEEYESAIGLEDRFDGNPDSLIYVGADEGDGLWHASKLLSLRHAAEDILKLPSIKSVTTIADLPVLDFQLGSLAGTIQRSALNAKLKQGDVPDQLPSIEMILPKRISDRGEWSDAQLDQLTDWLSKRRVFAERLTSHDRKGHLMLIEVAAPHEIKPQEQYRLLSEIREILERREIGARELYFSGLLTLQAASIEQVNVTLFTLLPIGASAIAIMVLLLFRRLEPIIIIAIVATVSVLWGVGFGDWLYGSFSVLTMAVPLMVVVISTGDIIHLISAYSADLNKGCAHKVALRKTFREMSSACMLTSLTTFIGFASLGLVPSQTIRQFGISAAVGVASALILSVILVPIFLDLLDTLGRTLRVCGSESRRTLRFAVGAMRIGLRAPILITCLFAGMLVLGLFYSSRLSLDPDINHRFRKYHPIAQSTDYFIQQFGGVNSVELVLSGAPKVLLADETFRNILSLTSTLCRDSNVTRIDSLAAFIASMLESLDYANEDGIPQSFAHASGLVNLLEQVDPRVASTFITSDHKALRIVAQVRATSYLELRQLSSEVIARARSVLPQSITIREKGSAPLIGKAVREIILGHLYGFGVSFMMIVILISIGLRSFRLALVAVPTNLIPLTSLGGLLAWTSDVADSDILGVATLGLGLAVDDTIHFLSRYRRELRHSATREAAIESTVQHTGIAVVRTTAILVVGFLPFAASDYWSINMMGTYLVAILLIALLADLLLLPALVKLFGPQVK